MELPDSGDADSSSWTNCPSQSDLDEAEASEEFLNSNEPESEFSSPPTTGYVILTLNQQMEDGMKVSEFISSRLNLLFVQPTLISLEQLKAKKLLKKKTNNKSGSIRSGKESEATTGDESDNCWEASENGMMETRGVPLWKYLVMQRIRKQQQLNENLLNNNTILEEEGECSQDDENHDQIVHEKISSETFDEIEMGDFPTPVPSETEPPDFDTSSSWSIKGRPKKKEMKRLRRHLDEIFNEQKSVVLEDEVSVLLIDSLFTCQEEVDIVEQISEKHEFRVVALSNPLKANVLRTLVAIGQQKKNVMRQKRLQGQEEDAENIENNNYVVEKDVKDEPKVEKVQSEREFLQSAVTDFSELATREMTPGSAASSKKKVTFLHNALEDIESCPSVFPPSIRDWVKQRQDIISSKPRSSPRRCRRQARAAIGAGSDSDSNSVIQSSGDSVNRLSNDSSVFEMGEENLFVCLNQVPNAVKMLADPSKLGSVLETSNSSIVVIVRDLDPENNSNFSLARHLKEKLMKNKVHSYVIPVQSLLEDVRSLQVMRGYSAGTKNDLEENKIDKYIQLVLAIIAKKVYTKCRKMAKVVIVDLGSEDSVGLATVQDFCTHCAHVHTLERRPGETFNTQLENTCEEVLESCKKLNWSDLFKETSKKKRHLHSSSVHVHNINTQDSCSLSSMGPSDEMEINSQKFTKLKINEIIEDVHSKHNSNQSSKQVLSKLISKMETLRTPSSNAKANENKNKTVAKTHKLKKRRETESRRKLIEESKRFQFDQTDSESSANLNELFTQRPKLLKIQLTPGNSATGHYNANLLSQKPSCLDEEYLYKGWVAIPKDPEEITPQARRCPIAVERVRSVMMRALKPIGSLFSCQSCCVKSGVVVPLRRQRHEYRGIPIDPDIFDGIYNSD